MDTIEIMYREGVVSVGREWEDIYSVMRWARLIVNNLRWIFFNWHKFVIRQPMNRIFNIDSIQVDWRKPLYTYWIWAYRYSTNLSGLWWSYKEIRTTGNNVIYISFICSQYYTSNLGWEERGVSHRQRVLGRPVMVGDTDVNGVLSEG